MTVYRNLQEQVFENAKDIEQLQQNTNNLELDIIDEQNKTQHLFSDSTLTRFNLMDNENDGIYLMQKNNMSFFVNSKSNNDITNQTEINMKPNEWSVISHRSESDGPVISILNLYPDNMTYSYGEKGSGAQLLWAVRQQVQTDQGFSSRLDSYDRKTHGKYLIDSYTIDEATQTINLTLSEQL